MTKVVAITGASAGIGEALVRDFHARGYRVALLARRLGRLQDLSTELNSVVPNSAYSFQCDVTVSESVHNAFQKVVEHFGRIDGVIANAGFGVAGNVSDLNIEDYERQFATNVFGVLECFYASKEALIQSQGFFGVVGSVNSYVSLPTTSAYAMSKFAVRALTEALYFEMKPLGVSITLICPGFVKTEIRLGAILIVTGIRFLRDSDDTIDSQENNTIRFVKKFLPTTKQLHGSHFFVRENGIKKATPLFLALVVIEITDLVFAVDSIPAVFAVTHDAFVAFASNILAILGLRALYFVLADWVGKLRYLKPGLAVILCFIGGKMVLVDFIKVPSSISLLVIFAVLTTAGLGSWYAARIDAKKK